MSFKLRKINFFYDKYVLRKKKSSFEAVINKGLEA